MAAIWSFTDMADCELEPPENDVEETPVRADSFIASRIWSVVVMACSPVAGPGVAPGCPGLWGLDGHWPTRSKQPVVSA